MCSFIERNASVSASKDCFWPALSDSLDFESLNLEALSASSIRCWISWNPTINEEVALRMTILLDIERENREGKEEE